MVPTTVLGMIPEHKDTFYKQFKSFGIVAVHRNLKDSK